MSDEELRQKIVNTIRANLNKNNLDDQYVHSRGFTSGWPNEQIDPVISRPIQPQYNTKHMYQNNVRPGDQPEWYASNMFKGGKSHRKTNPKSNPKFNIKGGKLDKDEMKLLYDYSIQNKDNKLGKTLGKLYLELLQKSKSKSKQTATSPSKKPVIKPVDVLEKVTDSDVAPVPGYDGYDYEDVETTTDNSPSTYDIQTMKINAACKALKQLKIKFATVEDKNESILKLANLYNMKYPFDDNVNIMVNALSGGGFELGAMKGGYVPSDPNQYIAYSGNLIKPTRNSDSYVGGKLNREELQVLTKRQLQDIMKKHGILYKDSKKFTKNELIELLE